MNESGHKIYNCIQTTPSQLLSHYYFCLIAKLKHMKQNKFIFNKFIAIFIITFVLFLTLSLTTGIKVKTGQYFTAIPSPLKATYDLFDLGVVDVDSNSFLDIFTLNHSARQNILMAESGGTVKFKDSLSAFGMSQDESFPALEDRYESPKIDRPGIYIYREKFKLNIRSHSLTPNQNQTGEFQVSLPVNVKSNQGFEVSIESEALPTGAVKSSVIFTNEKANALLVLDDFPELPHSFKLSQQFPLDQVFIGHDKINPESNEFNLMWRDRHSMAWTDLNGDRILDVFMGRGAARGNLTDLPDKIEDELFVSIDKSTFKDTASNVGFRKEGCPGRQSAWVDYNNDNLLDLYISCGRGKPDESHDPNQLYEQTQDGNFVEIAANVGLALSGHGPFSWLDLDNDGYLDLLASQGKDLTIYWNRNEKFQRDPQAYKFDAPITKLAVSDFDNDGDWDIYVVTHGNSKNGLIIGDGSSYNQASDLMGLPDRTLNASWVDYDNDGFLDLYAVPEGIYNRQEGGNFFTGTGLLRFQYPGRDTWSALNEWFDYDNDGTRDLLIAYRQTPSILQQKPSLYEKLKNQLGNKDTKRIWQSSLYKNHFNKNNWLQIRLTGIPGNRQAIGAVVQMVTEDGRQMEYLGISDNSLYSQGHFRLYFGLGNNKIAKSIQVDWPDQMTTELKDIKANQIIEIKHPMAS